ncbi:MAG TPA: hypothetical protein VGP55_10235 [Chitinophagaceae bacterium]|nr:hypothetical protein [Chitinophagaceae bacterium]
MNLLVDKWKYGFLKPQYRRKFITQKNDEGLRSSKISNKGQIEASENVKFLDDSFYHELKYYNWEQIDYFIKLKYHYHGIYTGTIEYMDHTKSDWRNNKIIKIEALITFNLNLANKMTGVGSYKYFNRDDFGKFDFQIDEQNLNRIIAKYENTIPSGLSEGYEIWEKV